MPLECEQHCDSLCGALKRLSSIELNPDLVYTQIFEEYVSQRELNLRDSQVQVEIHVGNVCHLGVHDCVFEPALDKFQGTCLCYSECLCTVFFVEYSRIVRSAAVYEERHYEGYH